MIGIDVSHWQSAIDWAKVADEVEFAIIKCTQGIDLPDEFYPINQKGCEDNCIPYGAYHFLEPLVDGTKQAEYFWKHLLDWGINVMVLDCEWGDVGVAANIEKFITRLRALSGKEPWIYTNANFWNTYIGKTNPAWAQDCPRWVANPTTAAAPLLPLAWDSYELWQYSWKGTVSGIDGSVDLNRPHPDFDILTEFGCEFEPIPDPDPIPAPDMVRVTASGGLYIRNAPNSVTGAKLGAAYYGSVWYVMRRVTVDGREWVQVGDNAFMAGWYTTRV